MATSRTALKQFFEAYKKPTESQFAALIDSFVHLDDDLATLVGAMAELVEAEQGNVEDKYMSPYLTKVAIYSLTRLANIPVLKNEVDFLIGTLEATLLHEIENHSLEYNNPHQVTKTQVGLSEIPNAKSDSVSLDDSEVLATSKAVHTLNQDKQDALTAMRYILSHSSTPPAASGCTIGDIAFCGTTPAKTIYIHNGDAWILLS